MAPAVLHRSLLCAWSSGISFVVAIDDESDGHRSRSREGETGDGRVAMIDVVVIGGHVCVTVVDVVCRTRGHQGKALR